MSQSLESRQTLRGIQFQTPLHEAELYFLHLVQVLYLQGFSDLDFGELYTPEPLTAFQDALLGGRQRPKCFLDEVNLIEFVLSGEHGLSTEHFPHDTPDCPYVNLLAIPLSNQKLRTPVPSRRYVLSHFQV